MINIPSLVKCHMFPSVFEHMCKIESQQNASHYQNWQLSIRVMSRQHAIFQSAPTIPTQERAEREKPFKREKKARYKESGMHAETSLWSGRQSADGIHCVCIVRKYDIGTFHHYRPTPRRRSPTHPICFILSTFSLESLANPDIPCLDFPLFSILMPLER